MKKLIIPFVALFVIAVSLTSWRSHAVKDNNQAFIQKDFLCGLFDGDGGFVISNNTQTVVTSSGNETLRCQASGVANSQGKAVVLNDFLCGGLLGLTTDSRETISASGQATLTCKWHN